HSHVISPGGDNPGQEPSRPVSRRANKRRGIPSKAHWQPYKPTWPRMSIPCFQNLSFWITGVRGSRLDRPALDRLRDQARLGEFEAVIILAPARLARSSPPQ